MTSERPRTEPLAPITALVVASYAFRLPALLNARSTNSDAAVVGLQAIHLLRGELAPFLWGSGYQTSADAVVAALFFAVLGPTPLSLMLSSLTLHVVATLLAFAALRRHFPAWSAALLALPLVVTTSSIHSYALYPPRQASLTLAIAAFWALDAAGPRGGSRAGPWLAAGGALSTLAVAADPYPILLVPLAAVFALLVAWAAPSFRLRASRVLAFVGGALSGVVPFLLLRRLPGANRGPLGLTTTMLAHHWELLVRDCLPWAVGLKVYSARHVMDYALWDAPPAARALQLAGAASLASVVLAALLAAPLARSVPWPVRRLGLVGALVYPLAIGAFLVSVMVMDHFSMRYLAALALLTPFAAAPLCAWLGPRRFALVLAPHLLATALGGWVGYGPFVRGGLPVRETPELADDLALERLLQARGITHAIADYWASYRLTLLYAERIVVVPRNEAEDRYRPYRVALETARVFAYIHDRDRSREDVATAERELRQRFPSVERLELGAHTVFVVTRAPNP